jgi:hypothetical protein
MQQSTEQMNKYRSSFVEMENCFLVAFSRFSSEKRFCLHSVATMNNGEGNERKIVISM